MKSRVMTAGHSRVRDQASGGWAGGDGFISTIRGLGMRASSSVQVSGPCLVSSSAHIVMELAQIPEWCVEALGKLGYVRVWATKPQYFGQ